MHDLVQREADLTAYPGIGRAIDSAIREIVLTGTLGRLEQLRSESSPELITISDYPRLNPKRILRIYKKLAISSIAELRKALEAGEIERCVYTALRCPVEQYNFNENVWQISRSVGFETTARQIARRFPGFKTRR